MDTQLDPSIIALTKAIGHQESGGKYDKVGDNGHSKGAYQWNNAKTKLGPDEIPVNFRGYASEVGADPNDFSPENQDRVAYKTVEKWGKEGLTPAQIASKWNSGGADTYKTAKPGYNAEQGVNYDVKSYVDNVSKYYDQFLGSQSNLSNNQSLTKDPLVDTPPPQQFKKKEDTTFAGDVARGIVKPFAKLATSGVNLVQDIAGAEETQPLSGSYLGEVKKIGDGFDPLGKPMLSKDNVGAIGDAVGTGVELGLLTEGGGLLKNLLRGKGALGNSTIKEILKGSLGKGETIKSLSRQDAITTLNNYLKEMSVSQAGGKTEQAILKALAELNPAIKKTLLQKSKGMIGGLIKNVGGIAVGAGLGATGKGLYDRFVR